MSEERYLITINELEEMFQKLSKEYHVVAPTSKNGVIVFDFIEKFDQIKLDYIRTILPLKKFLFPNKEKLFEFQYEKKYVKVREENPSRKYAFFLIHPCDVNALKILDRILNDKYIDEYYFRRRRESLIITLECIKGDEYCFCESMGTDEPWKNSFDVLLHPLNEKEFLAIPGSAKGFKILRDMRLKKTDLKKKRRRKNTLKISIEKIERIKNNVENQSWIEEANKCISCGACTVVCPTCICFGVRDLFKEPLRSGYRFREWNSCIYSEFTRIAGNIVFRKEKVNRFKHRFYHKFVFIKERYDVYGCVGCGRCIAECINKINIVEVINKIA